MSIPFSVRRSSAFLGGIFFCFSFASGQQAPIVPPLVPPTGQSSQSGSTAPAPTEQKSEAGSSADTTSYKVGPADVLSVKVWNEEKFSGPVVVHQDGQITIPLVGDLPAGGTTPKEIEKVITAALAKYVVKPLVTVTVQDVVSKRYYLDQMALHPGEYQLSMPTTVLEAISKAGGVQDFANQKKIYILRGDKRIPFNLKDVLHGKHMEQNIQIEPGDHIVIP